MNRFPVRYHVSLTREQKRLLKKVAKKFRMTEAEVMRRALDNLLSQHKDTI